MSPLDQKKLLESLAEHAGYRLLQRILQEQVDQLQREILFTVCTTEELARMAEYKKGQLEGRLSLEDLRMVTIDNLNIDIEKEKANAERTSDNRDAKFTGNDGGNRNAP